MINTNFRRTSSSLSYDANNAYLDLSLNYTPGLPSNGLSGNQQAVGNALINFFNTNGGIPLLYGALNGAGLTQGSGEIGTGSLQTTFDAMGQFMGLITDPFMGRGAGINGSSSAPGFAEEGDTLRLRRRKRRRTDAFAMFTKAPLASLGGGWSVWARALAARIDHGNPALVRTTHPASMAPRSAPTICSRRTRLRDLRSPAAAPILASTVSAPADPICSRPAPICVIPKARPTSAGALAYGWQDITTNRTVTIAGLDQLRAEFNANAYSGRVEGGYRFVAPATFVLIGITPYAAGQFTTFDLPAYVEQAIAGSNERSRWPMGRKASPTPAANWASAPTNPSSCQMAS